jgi:hypothetical protein
MTKHPPARLIHDTEAVTLRYYPGPKIVHHELRRFVHGMEFRAVLEKGLELLIAHRACKWLSDDRGNGPLTLQDAEWAESDWAPRVLAAGWKFWAVVLPEKATGQMNMRRKMSLYVDQGVTVQSFASPDEALTWLAHPTISPAALGGER